MRLPLHLLRMPLLWWIGLSVWFAVMFTASSFAVAAPTTPLFEIPHLDKIVHFGWFTAGGFILANALLLKNPPLASRRRALFLAVIVMSAFGAFDEFRQSFTPGRSGNDLGDWIADTLGGFCGVLVANAVHRMKMIRQFVDGSTQR